MLSILVVSAVISAQPQVIPPKNAKCPVEGCKVDAKSPVAIVHGRAYYCCCAMCKAELEKHPAKYLKPDGTPRNQ